MMTLLPSSTSTGDASYGAEPRHPDGRAIRRDVPLEFMEEFSDLINTYGIMGKFSVVPYPAGLGPLTDGWPGGSVEAIEKWVSIVQRRIASKMDISPEMPTHYYALDLETRRLLPEREDDWSDHQTAQALLRYISYGLEILREVGLRPTGVTSPWDFGSRVEEAYRQAIADAFENLYGSGTFWYFLHVRPEGEGFHSTVAVRKGHTKLVSIASEAKDYLWQAMEVNRSDAAFIAQTASLLLSEDGNGGRLAELFNAEAPLVFHTHWQSLFSDRRRTGLRALETVCQRMEDNWQTGFRWTKCSQFAENISTHDADTPGNSVQPASGSQRGVK